MQAVQPLTRIHALPKECHNAFMWLLDMCKEMEAEVGDVMFTSSKGRFLRAEGTVRRGEKSLRFLVSDYDDYGSMNVHVSLDEARSFSYRVYHEYLYDARPTYPLTKLLNTESKEEADALAEVMETLFVDDE